MHEYKISFSTQSIKYLKYNSSNSKLFNNLKKNTRKMYT
jgi:hypothetical protein